LTYLIALLFLIIGIVGIISQDYINAGIAILGVVISIYITLSTKEKKDPLKEKIIKTLAEEGEIILPKDKNKRNAYRGEKNFIADWIKFSLTFVKSKGSITFINHIKNLPDILSIFAKSMGDVNVTPIFTDFKKPATRFLIRGIRDSRKPIKIRKGLILKNKNGKTPKKIENILRHGKAL
jgi:hypothetical protein